MASYSSYRFVYTVKIEASWINVEEAMGCLLNWGDPNE